eukprot:TRINITY_DN70359_c0_g1_i1.p1 TRINITY_DN70359_c0_g1~~TRINITY_DN70359_c0_g1_i1.p1  ORF type:complete len:282 (+),score=90.08 TRINITY_DN70359_c0_g1_i1:91-846(+)
MAAACGDVLTHTPMPLAYAGAQYPKEQTEEGTRKVASARAELMQALHEAGSKAAAEPVALPRGVAEGAVCTRVRGLLTPDQCASLVRYSEAVGFEAARVNIDFEGHDIPAVRNNWRTMIDDEQVAAELYRRVKDFVPQAVDSLRPCGTNRRFRVLRYDAHQQFSDHADGRYTDPETGAESVLTFQVYLTDDFSEGATTFVGPAGDVVDVLPVTGDALVFSHALVHRGTPPVGGRKYALRSEVMYEPAAAAP